MNLQKEIHPALAVVIVLGACLLGWAVLATLVLGALVVAGSWGVVGLSVALAAVWWGVTAP